jgi:hypothetical protein
MTKSVPYAAKAPTFSAATRRLAEIAGQPHYASATGRPGRRE